MARTLNPKLQRIGVAWNPAEINSEICTISAREVCRELKLELLEATVENTSSVKEAVASLLARDVDALWIGGDVTVLSTFDLVSKSANSAQIPFFTCMPGNAKRGSLFDLGANYYVVGENIGSLAAQVLKGADIAKLPVTKAVPSKLFVNTLVVSGLRAGWAIPPQVIEQADSTIDETGIHEKAIPRSP